jgi:hypothetical protein
MSRYDLIKKERFKSPLKAIWYEEYDIEYLVLIFLRKKFHFLSRVPFLIIMAMYISIIIMIII